MQLRLGECFRTTVDTRVVIAVATDLVNLTSLDLRREKEQDGVGNWDWWASRGNTGVSGQIVSSLINTRQHATICGIVRQRGVSLGNAGRC